MQPSLLVAALVASTHAAHIHLRDAKAYQVDVWGQCGGKEYRGDTRCTSGNTCKVINEWYSQCQPGGEEEIGTWGQCGGKNYKGATKCAGGGECKAWSDWYSQCIPGSDAVTAPLNWAQDDGVCFSKVDGESDTTTTGITSYDACIIEANKRGKLYANWKDNVCTVLSTVYTYTLDKACKSAAKYDLDKYTCSGNSDFYGSDIGQAQTRFDRCMDECEFYSSGGHKCNAVMWVRNPGSDFGVCYFKSFDDYNRKPSTSWLGGIACKRNPKYFYQ
uniref:Secreted protein n=1 Tax=Achlya hypogyna TaxID=1202772 RepID=A0A0A7CN20_ACHHY|nr:secreted protein [Achlya hypogyna]